MLARSGEPVIAWARGLSDGIPIAEVVTPAAVRFYLDISAALRKDPRAVSRFAMQATELTYLASIRYRPYFKRGAHTYFNVYVAEINLGWSQHCGPLCGSAFWRNKVVVLDFAGAVKALYLDAPVNFVFTTS